MLLFQWLSVSLEPSQLATIVWLQCPQHLIFQKQIMSRLYVRSMCYGRLQQELKGFLSDNSRFSHIQGPYQRRSHCQQQYLWAFPAVLDCQSGFCIHHKLALDASLATCFEGHF